MEAVNVDVSDVSSEKNMSCLLCIFLSIILSIKFAINLVIEIIPLVVAAVAPFLVGVAAYFLIIFIIARYSAPTEVNFSVFRKKRDVSAPAELDPAGIDDYNIYSAEVITIFSIVLIEYILTGLIFWYAKKGNHRLILPYLMFLMVTINVLLIFFLHLTIQNFQVSSLAGFLALASGLLVVGNGVYFWVIMYRRYQNLKDDDFQPII